MWPPRRPCLGRCRETQTRPWAESAPARRPRNLSCTNPAPRPCSVPPRPSTLPTPLCFLSRPLSSDTPFHNRRFETQPVARSLKSVPTKRPGTGSICGVRRANCACPPFVCVLSGRSYTHFGQSPAHVSQVDAPAENPLGILAPARRGSTAGARIRQQHVGGIAAGRCDRRVAPGRRDGIVAGVLAAAPRAPAPP